MSKMRAVLKVLLLMALLVSAQGWDNYWSLPDSYRTHTDKALRNANGKFGGPYHVAYNRLLSSLRITDSSFYIRVRLMVTTCKKDPNKGFGHRDECATQKPSTPWIDCVVCKPKNGAELIDCARQMDVKDRESIRSSCPTPSDYHLGGGSINLEDDGPQYGCLGCV
ncbi:cystatin-like protein isoform X3 [Colossoma macropomum]|uniref:cystatin-like protein isoform X3 n=1 Tax=Colossoma macropomum TaxID=42526 RepID=UPI00186439D4|nr:cystatin-like protein isoform X3 [Colossoma macropomum]